jgi:hypothetical protein
MQTLPVPTPHVKAFYAHLDGQAGVLAQVAGQILFMRHDDGALIDYVPALAERIVVLGECGLAETQALADRRHGGYAAVACSRLQEVR